MKLAEYQLQIKRLICGYFKKIFSAQTKSSQSELKKGTEKECYNYDLDVMTLGNWCFTTTFNFVLMK